MQRIELPTKTELTKLLVKKIQADEAILEVKETGLGFAMPTELLPKNIDAGEYVFLKVLTAQRQEEDHTAFARRLLEEIIN